jgi:hypothetical protein
MIFSLDFVHPSYSKNWSLLSPQVLFMCPLRDHSTPKGNQLWKFVQYLHVGHYHRFWQILCKESLIVCSERMNTNTPSHTTVTCRVDCFLVACNVRSQKYISLPRMHISDRLLTWTFSRCHLNGVSFEPRAKPTLHVYTGCVQDGKT